MAGSNVGARLISPIKQDEFESGVAESLSMVSGDFLEKIELTNALIVEGGSAILQQIPITNIDGATALDFDLIFFGADVTVTSAAAATLNITDENWLAGKFLCKTSVRSGSTTPYTAGNATQIAQQGLIVTNKESTPGKSIWMVVVSLSTFTTVAAQFVYTPAFLRYS